MDLGQRKDEELVWAAQHEGCRLAMEALILRYLPRIRRWIAPLAKRLNVPVEDIRDGEQEAFFAFLEAIDSFDLAGERQRRSGFGTYLFLKINHRFRDFSRRVRRVWARLHGPVPALGRLGAPARELPPPGADDPATNPALTAERHEMTERIRDVVAGLPVRLRWLWEKRTAGRPLTLLARQQGVSYHRVYYQWQCMLAAFAAALQDWFI